MVATNDSEYDENIAAQAFQTPTGKKLLLVNKRNREIKVTVPKEFENANLSIVDEESKDNEARHSTADGRLLTLRPFSVMVAQSK